MTVDRICSVADCAKPIKGRGWCQVHYQRWYKFGDPNVPVKDVSVDPVARFADGVAVGAVDECWRWVRSTNQYGYGQTKMWDKNRLAHRVAYELWVGPIPDGLELDHLCSNRRCCNPAHLEPVTQAENVRRAAARVTHCPQGHAYDEANTYHNGTGRSCKECRRAAVRRYRARKAAA